MTCRALVMPPLPRAIREAEIVKCLPDGRVLVVVAETVECPACHRMAAFIVVRAWSWGCVECEEAMA